MKARKALHHAQVVHSQLRGLSTLSRELWNRMLEQLQLMWPKWLKRTKNCCPLSPCPWVLYRRKPLLQPFNIEHRSQRGSRDDKQASGILGYCCLLWFAQFFESGRILVWQLPSQEFSLWYLQPTVKFGDFSVMV